MTGLEKMAAALAEGRPTICIFAVADAKVEKGYVEKGYTVGLLVVAPAAAPRILASLLAGVLAKAVDAPGDIARLLPREMGEAVMDLVCVMMENAKKGGGKLDGVVIIVDPPKSRIP